MPEFNFGKTLFFPEQLDTELKMSSSIAILCSGGVESAVLAGLLLSQFNRVIPIYIRFGLPWESVELAQLQNYLASIKQSRLADLIVLEQPVTDVYQNHWSLNKLSVPNASTADSAVYLPGRNLLLLSKAALWCSLNGVSIVAIGTLSSNPFGDATDSFFSNLEKSLSEGLEQPLQIVRPLSKMHKEDVLQIGKHLPIHLSFSCIGPSGSKDKPLHCGTCNKCHERQLGFVSAGLIDKTEYAASQSPTSRASKLCIK